MLCKVVIDRAGLIIHILMIFAELHESAHLLLQFCLQHVNPLSLEAQQLHDRPEDHGCLASACPGTSGHAISHFRALHSNRAVDDHTHARQTNAHTPWSSCEQPHCPLRASQRPSPLLPEMPAAEPDQPAASGASAQAER